MNKRLIFNILIILMLAIVIWQLGNLTSKIISHYTELNSDPLAYGANKYNIDSCTCFISESKSIFFNKNGSWTRISQKGIYKDYKLNTSQLEDMINGAG